MILFFFNKKLSLSDLKLMLIIWSTVEVEMLDSFEADINISFSWVCILSSDFHHFECNNSELS